MSSKMLFESEFMLKAVYGGNDCCSRKLSAKEINRYFGRDKFWSIWIEFEFTFTFTFMHLADAFIQSDLHCIQVTVSTFYQLLLSLGIEPMILALLAPCSTSWATGKFSVYHKLCCLKGILNAEYRISTVRRLQQCLCLPSERKTCFPKALLKGRRKYCELLQVW